MGASQPLGKWSRGGELRSLFVHLRLHFQLLLAPLFLWGYALGGGGPSLALILAFVAFHVFLYGGTTAFNSAYDRDEGPVGGLYEPPPVSPRLLPFSLLVQALGALLAAAVSVATLGVYLVMVAFGAAYSHPLTHWKRSPASALPTIAVGQGVLGFLAGLSATLATLDTPGTIVWLGALSAALVVTGFYPLSSLFQIEEDRRRGDRSIAVAWSVPAAFNLALGCFLLAAPLLAAAAWLRFGPADAALLALGMLALAAAVLRWRRTFRAEAVRQSFLTAMRLNAASAAGFSAYLLWRIVT